MKILRRAVLSFLTLFLTPFLLFCAVSAPAWQAEFRGTSNGYVAFDGQGNLFTGAPVWGAFLAKLAPDNGAEIWRKDLSGGQAGRVYAVGKAGPDAVVVLVRQDDTEPLVAKVRSSDSATLWTSRLTMVSVPPSKPSLTDNYPYGGIAVDVAGDVFAQASDTIVKLSGTDGAELWHTTVPGFSEQRGFFIDHTGNLIVGAYVQDPGTGNTRTGIVKVNGLDGSVLWQQQLGGLAPPFVDVDGNGDVIAAKNSCSFFFPGNEPPLPKYLSKRSGVDGTELWSQEVTDTVCLKAVAADPSGDILVAGQSASGEFLVAKYSGVDGGELWRTALAGGFYGVAEYVRAGASGDVVALGILGHGDIAALARPRDRPLGSDYFVEKLSGADGTTLWSRTIGNPSDQDVEPHHLALSPDGDIVFVGHFLFKLNGSDGSDTEFVSGQKVTLRAKSPQRARLSVVFRDQAALPVPRPGSAEDPTIGGARLEVRSPLYGESDVYELPATGWQLSNNSVWRPKFKYVDHTGANGPCYMAKWLGGKVVVRCRGAGINFTLNEGRQWSLALTLSAGPDLARYCALFGGDIKVDSNRNSMFKAVRAPNSHECPAPLP